ncbi:MAG: hypothetical protein OEO79_12865 [Gemmatimonadota bacterium]|nr:hypothetical protein [Gemmatimonadota bacterium]
MEWWQIQELMWTSAGILASLIVVSGLTLRFAIKPFLGDLAKLRERRRAGNQAASDLRLDRLEERMEVLGSSVDRLADVLEFDRQLGGVDASSEGPIV